MNNKTILVIDDDEEVLSLFETFLTSIGYNSVTKASGESAKKWLKSNKPDLVLLDMMLPDIMGIDFANMQLSLSKSSRVFLWRLNFLLWTSILSMIFPLAKSHIRAAARKAAKNTPSISTFLSKR